MARDGFAVVVNFAGRAEPAEALASRIEHNGGAAIAVKADVSNAAEGIESVILSSGVDTSGTNHFANAGRPEDKAWEAEYANGPTRDLAEQARKGDESIRTDHIDPADVGRAVVDLVAMPHGRRPFRVTADPMGRRG